MGLVLSSMFRLLHYQGGCEFASFLLLLNSPSKLWLHDIYNKTRSHKAVYKSLVPCKEIQKISSRRRKQVSIVSINRLIHTWIRKYDSVHSYLAFHCRWKSSALYLKRSKFSAQDSIPKIVSFHWGSYSFRTATAIWRNPYIKTIAQQFVCISLNWKSSHQARCHFGNFLKLNSNLTLLHISASHFSRWLHSDGEPEVESNSTSSQSEDARKRDKLFIFIMSTKNQASARYQSMQLFHLSLLLVDKKLRALCDTCHLSTTFRHFQSGLLAIFRRERGQWRHFP